MEKVVQNNDATLNAKREYLYNLFRSDPRLARKYNEVSKYCKVIKKDLDKIIFNDFRGGDLNRFLELVFRETLIIYFEHILKFSNVKNEEDLYNTLYYLSFEYLKVVKKDEYRKAYIDKKVSDLKVMAELFSNQALTKDSFKNFDFNRLSSRKIVGFLLEKIIKTYQSKSKNISKEESEANIVYSLINLYMTSELERVFLNEHLEDYKRFKQEKEKCNEDIIEIDNVIKENEEEIINLEATIDTDDSKLEKYLNHNSLVKKVFYNKKITSLDQKIEYSEKKVDSLRNQNKNNRNKLKAAKTKLTKLEREFKSGFENELEQLNKYYETNLVINIEDFEDKNKLKKKSKTISKDIIERLDKLGIKVANKNFELNDYVELKNIVNDYIDKFSNKNVYHRKITALLNEYGYYLK